ncbi:MAG: hypothetical protein J6B62_07505, partial [Bacteroidales bacterium]|nr:hypothetical protein [Bacteroidales bacterium]
LKKAYVEDPIFTNSKVVLSLYDEIAGERFSEDFKEKIMFGGVEEKDLEILSEPSGNNLAKLALNFSDGFILGSETIAEDIVQHGSDLGLPMLKFDGKSMEDGTYIDEYNKFYDII